MKKILVLTTIFLISLTSFSQKDAEKDIVKNQTKAAEKELKKGKVSEALVILNEVESKVAEAPDADKAKYYFIKGNIFYEMVNKKIGDEDENLSFSVKSYKEMMAVEKTIGKAKYTEQANTTLISIKQKLVGRAIENSTNKQMAKSADQLYEAYQLDKRDTINLYYSANGYLSVPDYNKALQRYEELKNINYSGKATLYYALNKETKKEEAFPTKDQRDLYVKLGTHEKPREEVEPSKRGEVYKNMALILVQNGKIDQAKKAIVDARKQNPDDDSLILTEANLYLETKDYATYKKLVSEVLQKNPKDVDLVFNLGVLSATAKDVVEAEKYYKKAIEINPSYTNAYINLAALKLENEKAIMDEMNKLGTSQKEMKRWTDLNAQRKELYKSVIPYLKKAVELDPKNIDLSKTLLTVYSALEMTVEYKDLKAKIKSLEN